MIEMVKSWMASQRLLKNNTDDSNNSSNEDDDDTDNNKSSNYEETVEEGRRGVVRRNRHQYHRRARRASRVFMISIGIIALLLMIYIPIFNSVHYRTMPLPGWGYNISRNISDYVMPNDDTALIEPRSVCLHNFFVLIVVCSSVNNFVARQTVRETWGNVTEFNYPVFAKMHANMAGQFLDIRQHTVRLYADHLNLPNFTDRLNESSHNSNLPVRVVFLLGKHEAESHLGNESIARLKLESEQYDDLIQENFIDSYNNLTVKSVMMLKWIRRKCTDRPAFIMKCDDDTFVNVPNLLHVLLGGTVPVYNDTIEFYDMHTVNALSPSNRMLVTQNLLTGFLFCSVKPVDDVTSKWYAPVYMFSGDIYPHYISGSSYLMSFDVVNKLFDSALNTSILHLEDVYLTGVCSEKIHLRRRHHPLFSFNHKKKKCSYKGAITEHYLKGELMRDVYNFVLNTTIYCSPPSKYFKIKKIRPKNCS